MNKYQEGKYDVGTGKVINRATGEPIPDDEPVFIFRAKDLKAVHALIAYRCAVDSAVIRTFVDKRIQDFHHFEARHPDRCKEPD